MNIPQPRKIPKIETTIQELEPLYRKFTLPLNNTQNQAGHQLNIKSNTHQNLNSSEEIIKLQDQLDKVTQAQIVDSILLTKYKQKCDQLMETCQKLLQIVETQKVDYNLLQTKYIQVVSLSQDFWTQKVPQKFFQTINIVERPKAITNAIQIQTQYWVPTIQVKHVTNYQDVKKKKTQGEEKADIVLKQLNQYLSNISNQVNNSLQSIKDQQITLADVIEKNEELSKQNNRLKQQIKQFNINTEKFKVWKQEVQSKMGKLQSLADNNEQSYGQIQSISEPYQPKSDIEIKQQNIYLSNELKKLQKIAYQLELKLNAEKLKNKIVARVSIQQQAITEQQTVNIQETVKTLTQLSSKLKVVSTYLLS